MVANLTKIVVFSLLVQINCGRNVPSQPGTDNSETPQEEPQTPTLQTGAEQMELLLPKLKGKSIGLVVNQTSRVGASHLVDTLLSSGISIKAIFAPEHGFRGTAANGEKVEDGKDAETELPIISLYGKKRKPGKKDLAGVDLLVFDIQDVGARFYTYISTLHYLMEAAAEAGIPLLVLDRPNPNGHYVDGPVLEKAYQSFVGMHPVPVVHGMTVGEYAKMINGEGWLSDKVQCQLEVIPCKNYTHQSVYELPVKPSPNLPNQRAIYLYPSLCFFEGTTVSLGRGTNMQFQVLGHPDFPERSFSFQPKTMEGAKYPKHEGKTCFGYDLTGLSLEELRQKKQLDLSYLFQFYKEFESKPDFFLENLFFDKLAGTATLRQQIITRQSEATIRASWQADLEAFKQMRKGYLLYPDTDLD